MKKQIVRFLSRCSSAIWRRSFLLSGIILASGVARAETPASGPASASAQPNPTESEAPIPSTGGWNAFLILDNHGVPLWTVDSFKVFDAYGCPEVIGLDDKGHCHVNAGYSGKWTTTSLIADPKWLGGLAHGDIDPRIDGHEFYVGSQAGNLYQVVSWPSGVLDYRLIASLPGREIHTLAAVDLDPAQPGADILAFTVPGGVFRVSPTGPHGKFEWKHLGDYIGRVRQAVVLPSKDKEPAQIITASRNGRLDLLEVSGGGLKWHTLYQEAMGMGRVALRALVAGQPVVLYSTLDDGRVLRHEQLADGKWETATIYNGPQGPRGVVSGQFDADPKVETVAIFGYSKKVELLSRRDGKWQAETIFEDIDKGHWLAAAEIDGRNNTHEIVATGYGGRIVYLSRPPGYGK